MSAEALTATLPDTDGRAGRRLILVFAVTQTLAFGAMIQSFTVLLVPMSEALDASRTSLASVTALSTLVGAVAAFPVGQLLDKYGGRLLMTAGSVIGVVAVVVWSQATSMAHLYIAFTLVGLSLAMSTYDAAFAVLVVATDARHRDQAILLVTMITGLATGLYYPLAGWLNAQLGWRDTLLVFAAALAIAAIPAHLVTVPSTRTHRLTSARRTGAKVGGALRTRTFWLLSFSFVAHAGSVSAFLLLVVSYLHDVGHSLAVASTVPVVVGVMQILSRIALGPLAQRFGMTLVTAVAMGVQGIGLLILPLAGMSVALSAACVATVGLGIGVSVVARPSIVADTFGVARFASIIAISTIPIALSRAGSPLVAAWLADSRFLVVTGIASLLAALALVPLIRRARVAVPAPAEIVVLSTCSTD